MTVRALSGLVVLNLSYAVVGLSLLWALGAFRTWSAALRLAGLGYLLGLAAFGVLWTTLLVAGVPFGGVGIVVSLVCLAAVGVSAGMARSVTPKRAWSTWPLATIWSLTRSATLMGMANARP